MTRKRENLVHKIFVCAAIFKLGHSSMARILNLSTIGLSEKCVGGYITEGDSLYIGYNVP